MDQEWSDWITHDGSGCPVSAGVLVEFESHLGQRTVDRSRGPLTPEELARGCLNSWYIRDVTVIRVAWGYHFLHPIVRYRVRKPRAMLDVTALAADPYAPPSAIGPEGPVRQPKVPA